MNTNRWRKAVFLLLVIIGTSMIAGCRPQSSAISQKPMPVSTQAPILSTPETAQIAITTSTPPVPNIVPFIDLKDRDLKLLTVEKEAGFQLLPRDGDANLVHPFVMQSLVSPDQIRVVHLIQRAASGQTDSWFRMDAMVVNPATREFTVYPIVNTWISSTYDVGSITRAYGFIDDERLVFVKPVGDSSKQSLHYDIIALNIRTGETVNLYEHALDDVSPDFFGHCWLDETTKTLYVNQYRNGNLWAIDLVHSKTKLFDRKFTNDWPTYRLFPSPHGDRIWTNTEGKMNLFDGSLTRIAAISLGKGQMGYPPYLIWNPENEDSVLGYTYDDSAENQISHEETIQIAPQILTLVDKQGNRLGDIRATKGSGAYIEWEGWLEGNNYGLIRYYNLDHTNPSMARKVTVSYQLVNIQTGEEKNLKSVDSPDQLPNPKPLLSLIGSNFALIDTDALMLWKTGTNSGQNEDQGLSAKDSKSFVWLEYQYQEQKTVLYRFDTISKSLTSRKLDGSNYNAQLLKSNWLVDDSMLYTHLP